MAPGIGSVAQLRHGMPQVERTRPGASLSTRRPGMAVQSLSGGSEGRTILSRGRSPAGSTTSKGVEVDVTDEGHAMGYPSKGAAAAARQSAAAVISGSRRSDRGGGPPRHLPAGGAHDPTFLTAMARSSRPASSFNSPSNTLRKSASRSNQARVSRRFVHSRLSAMLSMCSISACF